jgi:hypothetical protein
MASKTFCLIGILMTIEVCVFTRFVLSLYLLLLCACSLLAIRNVVLIDKKCLVRTSECPRAISQGKASLVPAACTLLIARSARYFGVIERHNGHVCWRGQVRLRV